MLAKKLLALACAGGILAIGACFLPPVRPQQPPPPQIDFHGIRRLWVTASSQSETHHIDPSTLAAAVAYQFNLQVDNRVITASPSYGSSHDGTLQIDILNESAAAQAIAASSGKTQWTLDVTLNATLTNSAGAILWHTTNFEIRSPGPIAGPNSGAVWESSPAPGQLRYWLSSALVNRLLNDLR